MRIRTEHVFPPIPCRDFDWQAIDDETYDGPGCPIGHGESELEAIHDLIEKTLERYPPEMVRVQ